ncbi:cyclopropane fatty acyl phospholipid synthase [Desulfobacter latus]|uniref:Cyclopropane fatty acyl phospholipid synthase n=1 Tax=Desulfobacter latus TaxID=2292 RepID=A0A850T7H5_9BACT|nr:cyclopropane fatty acyl phospholipid synthase [Desulfobacter latus]NWH04187.1 cyclopropane fatty acyl phospholipid synthase [Desulfobacter latus]
MKGEKAKQVIKNILSPLDIRINGDRPWDIQINNPQFYQRVMSGGSLALGESYMDGWWDCNALDEFFKRLLESRIDKKNKSVKPAILWEVFKARVMNLQRGARAFIIGRRHYDTGNRLFKLMLDQGLNYSCGYWHNACDLDEAQIRKLDLICRKIGLEQGMTVLDIGCGWGGFAKYAAETYGVKVKGITVSKEQAGYAGEQSKGLDVTIELADYHDLNERFDRIVSIGMFEHVGWKNYRSFMDVVHRCLKDDGMFLLHTIAGNTPAKATDPWIGTYIFPNSMLPSASQIFRAAEGLFILEDLHSLGRYYDQTLMAWYDNFTRNWDRLKDEYDMRFFRMWRYYLLSCAASFRSRRNQLLQIVFSKQGIDQVFRSEGELFI